jgi:hypothetical protein
MTLYAQKRLRLTRSLAREVVHRRHLLNTDYSSCLDTGKGCSQGNSSNRPRPGSSPKPEIAGLVSEVFRGFSQEHRLKWENDGSIE